MVLHKLNLNEPDFFCTMYKKKMKKGHDQDQQPAAELSDDVFILILARVTYMSLCRFKCVSRQWLTICSELDVVQTRSPQQTLSGIYHIGEDRRCLTFHDLSGGGPPLFDPDLSFLRGTYRRITTKECRGGLLLCTYIIRTSGYFMRCAPYIPCFAKWPSVVP
jgi:hypothetical protein